MADLRRLPTDDELRSEACTWIARLNAHNVSDEDKTRFEVWRTTHPRHARAYDLVSMVWQQMNAAGEVARAVSVGQTFNTITETAIRRSLERRSRVWRLGVATAAAMAALVCIAWWANTRLPDTVFQTAIGEHATIKLPDGSSLELNSNSRASLDYNATARVVRLERGEAYFEVEHDRQRPFWVAAGKSWVGAVGTAFNIDVRPADIRVTVSEGAVRVAPEPAQIPVSSLVKAGEQVRVSNVASEVRSLAPAQLTRSLAWRKGSIYFKDDRLTDVVDELSRYTTLKVVIEDERLQGLTIGGTFATSPAGIETLLVNLEKGFGLHVRRERQTAYISPE